MERLRMDVHKEHALDKEVKTVQLRKCWWVTFDVNGNAPENAQVVACATEELANEVKELFASMKNDGEQPALVLDQELFYSLMRHSVEGYNFDTYYTVQPGWAEDGEIIRSLAQLATPDIFDCERKVSGVEDGVYMGGPDEDMEEDDLYASDSVHGKDVNE